MILACHTEDPAPPPAVEAPEPNPIGDDGLLKHGGFEELDPDGLAQGWTAYEGPQPALVEQAGAPDGLRVLELADPRRTVFGQELELEPATEYTLTWSGRSDAPVEDAVTVVLREILPGWDSDTVGHPTTVLGPAWTDLTRTFVTSGEAFGGRLDVVAALPDGVTAWVDRLSLCRSAGGRCVDADDQGLPVDLVAVSLSARYDQVTRRGRMLYGLQPYDGRLYLGYGDATANTGPIDIVAYQPGGSLVTLAVDDPSGQFQTESIDLYRVLDGDLWIPAIDPRGAAGAHDFAVLRSGQSKFEATLRPEVCAAGQMCSLHVLDLASYDGALYAVGSDVVGDGAVWRSDDDGQSWVVAHSRDLDGPLPASWATIPRNYLLFAFDGRLWTQTAAVGDPQYAVTASDVFDGTAWSAGPNLLPFGQGYHPQVVGDRVLYLTQNPASGTTPYHAEPRPVRLLAFDGTAVTEPLGEGTPVLDFTVGAVDAYVLTGVGEVLRIPAGDFAAAESLGFAPPRAASLGVLDGELYLGTRDSALLVARDPVE